jgi:hypothetical protein
MAFFAFDGNHKTILFADVYAKLKWRFFACLASPFCRGADVTWWLLNEIHPSLPLEKEGAVWWVFGDVWALFQHFLAGGRFSE